MMTDRELLEMAAKASGIENILWHDSAAGGWVQSINGHPWWNPLNNDGDAFRLAVKLSLRVHHDGFCAIVELPPVRRTYLTPAYFSDEGNDLYADTRRAITRAAAEIGKGMP